MIGLDWFLSRIYSNITVDTGSYSYSLPDEIASISALIINGAIVEASSDLLPLYVSLQDSDGKFFSSYCANVIISPVCSFEDVAYGMYNTSYCIVITS